ncbi:MAG: ArdC family protein [Streptosporangiaceae bacterium]
MGYRKTTRRAGSGGNDEKYEQINGRIVAALERGTVPWREPWPAGFAPVSMSTGRRYHGINTFLLAVTSQERGYSSPYWGTFDQIAELAGMQRREGRNGRKFWVSPDGTPRGVRAGENRENGRGGTMITFWKQLVISETDPATGERVSKRIPLLRTFTVFNAEQADGLPEKYFPKAGDHQPIASAAQVLTDFYAAEDAPRLLHDVHGQAYFSHLTDEVHLPPLAEHETAERYYSTAFHETVHATGHHSRLARRQEGELRAFGSHDYGTEELTAEMGAAMLAAETGTETAETFEQSAAYLASWIRTIKEDTKMVVKAAAASQRAVDLILGVTAYQDADSTEAEQELAVAVAA